MKKSVKLMNKEEKEKRPGVAKKLDVPLSRREQGRLDRSAAYDTTNKTLDRWTETVKHNRRAEHLVFPLPENSESAGVDRGELQPLSAAKPANELESTIMAIMEQSGISLENPDKKKPAKPEYDEDGNELSKREIVNRRRLERELNSREAKRTKRIKKIKSKAYHRVHRKERERDELAVKEAMEEAGELDSEAEREAQDRRRALERVGQRHKDSKWAKLGNKGKRAVWDDDFRTGLTEMAKRDEELRRRKEGKRGGADDSDDTSSDGSDSDDDATLRRQLKELEEDEGEPQSKLMAMKFMQKSEAARKEANDQLIKDIRRELDGDEASDSDDEATGEVGRRSYGDAAASKMKPVAIDVSKKQSKKKARVSTTNGNGDGEDDDDDDVEITTSNGSGAKSTNSAWAEPAADSTAGAWSRGESRRKTKPSARATEDLDLNEHIAVASSKPKAKSSSSSAVVAPARSKATSSYNNNNDSDSDDDEAQHLPLAIRDQELVARAFAGEDVVGDFEREKAAMAEADDDKIIDNTLPGWGAWVGEGVSKRELKRNAGRFLTKVEGIKQKDRKDAKLAKVMINEKRIKKVCFPHHKLLLPLSFFQIPYTLNSCVCVFFFFWKFELLGFGNFGTG